MRRPQAATPPQPDADSMTDETQPVADADLRRAALIYDLRARLASVCDGWPPALFTSMVEGLADITMRYDGGTTTSIYDRRSSDGLVADMKEAIERNAAARLGRESGEHREAPETD